MNSKVEILGVAEVADLLKLDPQTVSRKAQKGEIPGFKIGNRWRFRLSDIEDWISQKVNVSHKSLPHVKSDLHKKIGEYFEKRGDVFLVYLFGSRATDKATEKSDLDIAILMKNKGDFKLDAKSRITSELMNLLKFNRIDVVFLNSTTPLLSYEIVRDGKILFLDPVFDIFSYKISILRNYQDTKHLRNTKYEYFLDAVNE